MKNITPFHVMKVLEQAKKLEKAGKDIIHMEVGEPDFPTPGPIIRAAQQALKNSLTRYTPAAGIPELRQAIASFYQQRYAITVSPERIIVTTGASGALQLVLAALINPGDTVLLPDPGYPCNRNFVELFNGKAVALNGSAENNFQPLNAQIRNELDDKVSALMLASPANPTGTVLEFQQLRDYQSILNHSHYGPSAALIVDEIYHGLTYDHPANAAHQNAATALALDNTEQVFIINSFSKYFGMTGWRLGWVVAPDAYVEVLERLAQNMFLCAPTPSQYAALAAFEDQTIEILEQRRTQFKERRNFLLPALRDLGFAIHTHPEGAFYLYANCDLFTDNSLDFASRLLKNTGVAITPGLDFGNNQPEKHVRFAYTTGLHRLEMAIDRLEKFLIRL